MQIRRGMHHARITVPYFAPMIDIVGVQCAQTASRINHVVCAMQKAAQDANLPNGLMESGLEPHD